MGKTLSLPIVLLTLYFNFVVKLVWALASYLTAHLDLLEYLAMATFQLKLSEHSDFY